VRHGLQIGRGGGILGLRGLTTRDAMQDVVEKQREASARPKGPASRDGSATKAPGDVDKVRIRQEHERPPVAG
jgi:hypothetical protein